MHGFKSAILTVFHFCQNEIFAGVHDQSPANMKYLIKSNQCTALPQKKFLNHTTCSIHEPWPLNSLPTT